MALNPNKELKLYYSIGEVAEMLGLSETLLRYWEKEFPSITPKKAGRNVRQYSQEDIDQLRLVRHLVKDDAEIVARLRSIREELMQIKKELDGLV